MASYRCLSAVLLFMLLTALPAQATGKPVLLWCLDHFPGFHHYQNVKAPSGRSVELMQELARRADFTLHFTPRTPVARCLRMLETGEADLMTNLKFSPKRAELMHLFPYNNTVPESLFVLKALEQPVSTQAELQKLRLISIRNYLYTPAIAHLLQQQRSQQVANVEAGLEMLTRRRIEGLLAPTFSTLDAIVQNPAYRDQVTLIPLDMLDFPPGNINIGFSRTSKHAELAPQIQQALQSMIDDGTIDRLHQLTIPEVVLTTSRKKARPEL